jgi:hypothetical protein
MDQCWKKLPWSAVRYNPRVCLMKIVDFFNVSGSPNTGLVQTHIISMRVGRVMAVINILMPTTKKFTVMK